MSDALPLPPRPNLERYKKLAKELQRACKSSDPNAIHTWAERWIETITRLNGVTISRQVRREISRESKRLDERWHKFKNATHHGNRCTLTDAQLFIAREHGFASWMKFAKHVENAARANSQVSNFEAAVDAIVNGDTPTLRKLLREHPDLVRARSTRVHHSTLLHYVSANGVEDFRQKTPKNIVEITNILLDAGADVNAESEAYGGGSTTVGLVATSVHPEQAGVQIPLLETLLDRGASVDQPHAGGNAQSVINACLANGQPEAAKYLWSRGAALDLEGAAALGSLDLVKSYFNEHGKLKRPATRQQMESGFLYACGYGRRDVVEFLIERGVGPALRNASGQTGLHWAAYSADPDIIRVLLKHSSGIDLDDGGLHPTALDLVLFVWTDSKDEAIRNRCYRSVSLLVRAGANLDLEWYHRDEDRRRIIEKIEADRRMAPALRGNRP
jgi:ankyrin repeat protein